LISRLDQNPKLQQILLKFEHALESKVDRLEFSTIIKTKANIK